MPISPFLSRVSASGAKKVKGGKARSLASEVQATSGLYDRDRPNAIHPVVGS
jgi:hypothetical protein